MFESLIPLFSIAMALMLGAISPGPSFIYVAQNSISKSRKHGLFTALGTGTGAALFGLLAVMGLQAVLLAVPSAYLILKIGGGLYLLWLAFKIIKHAKEPIAMENDGKSKMTYKQAYRASECIYCFVAKRNSKLLLRRITSDLFYD